MSRWGVLALTVAVVVTLTSLRTGPVTAQPARGAPKWEYQVLSESALSKAGGLNKVGEEGWELTAVEPKSPKLTGFNVNLNVLRVDKMTGLGSGSGMASGLTFAYEPAEKQYYFKRPK